MNLSLLDILLIIVIGHCLYLILSFQLIPQRNKDANKILQYLLAIYTCILLEGIIVFKIENVDLLTRYRGITTVIYFLIGPLIYTYLRRLLFSKNGSYNLNVLHYLPAIGFLLYSLIIVIAYKYLRGSKEFLTTSYFLFELFGIASICIYIFKSYRLLRYFEISEKQELSFNQTNSKYINRILFFMSACMLVWLISVINRYIFKFYGSIFTDLIWILFGAQAYIIGYYSLKQPKIFKTQLHKDIEVNSPKTTLRINQNHIDKLNNLVHTFLDNDKGYREPDLSLSIMADKLSTTTNDLSWFLNNIYNKSFYQLINEYRVKEFKKRIKNNEHKEYTVISIAYEVGFNSKSTFYKAFKEITSITPTEYIKKVENSNNLENQ
ncbi:helix-turn-helix domain-containing protein [Pseudotenacibaculum sp. MALMAid0570]|uniref:helix-turn-helix domain-containing protein n=1 Tax=Pseudotenacibaculum sp. MALMAid0570 TaxID=3143938 RepID=UPI0032DFC9C9